MHYLPSRIHIRISYIILIYIYVSLDVTIIMAQMEPEIKHAVIGESLTMTCHAGRIHDSFPIIWSRTKDLQTLDISYNKEVYAHVPEQIKHRIFISCYRGHSDRCSLKITPIAIDDTAKYECKYSTETETITIPHSFYINATYGEPPSIDLPFCDSFKAATGSIYSTSNTYDIGDQVYMRCSASDVSFLPTLSWLRQNHNIVSKIVQPKQASSLSHRYTLNSTDIGVVFTCSMSHPGLPEARNCSITPLPTTPRSSTQAPIPNTTNRLVSGPSVGKPVTDSNTSANSQSFLLPIIIAIIVLIVATVVVVLAIFLIKRRKKHNINPSKLNQDQSYDQDQSTAAEYAIVNTPDSIDKDNKHRVAKKNQQESTFAAECSLTGNTDITDEKDPCPLYAQPDKRKKSNDVTVEVDKCSMSITEDYAIGNAPDPIERAKKFKDTKGEDSNVADCDSSGTAYEDDVCPLYAQPDKRKKSNDLTAVTVEDHNRYNNSLSQQPSDKSTGTADEDSLMYADLDLTRTPESDSARMPPTDSDATVYADIKRSV